MKNRVLGVCGTILGVFVLTVALGHISAIPFPTPDDGGGNIAAIPFPTPDDGGGNIAAIPFPTPDDGGGNVVEAIA